MQERYRKLHLMWLGPAILGLLLGSTLGAAEQQASAASLKPVAARESQADPQPKTNEQPQETEAQTLHLLVGRSLVVMSPTRIKRVSLADPAIAEAIVISPTQVMVNGKAPGGVSLLMWDENDQSQAFELLVDADILGLSQKIHALYPAEAVKVEAVRDDVVLSGRVSSANVADKIIELAKSVNPKVTSFLQGPVAPEGQILLQVRFAEVDRTALSQFGFNLLSLPGAKNVGTISTQQYAPPQLANQQNGISSTSAIGLSNLLNIFIYRPDINLAAAIQALQENNVLQILAEPNLLTASGKEATFLAGGEFPFPVLQSAAGGTYGITIQFKEFGVRLTFTPTLTADGLIHLKVQPEVSSLDFSNALTLQGFVIPALSTRRVKSEKDLADGQSFAIAGLIDNRVTQTLEKVPGIGNIPILGKLFQSRSIQKSKSELLVVVTPRIVQPVAAANAPKGPVFPVPFLPPAVPEKTKPQAKK
ncbi:MAG: type II and III secretion system protein family protein [Candidatus Korobacteraceae bacterium]